ncbi:restriction endonuclease [Campylobacter sp. MIT 12-5580]|uniref:type II restriction endonuclease n=1 Tax=Campylobacter sp. MIT 12-5580 TaxID=2040651 RepID=UPI0010F597CF|nr:type II restriction endonuclease [Campylobacter sp. MIT 12-5580]TKX30137.1 restriction endonuclease [Campylobacter sp. MIT 12-5580]
MKNNLDFKQFLATLKPSNKNLAFYVDWQKCLKNRDEISISLNHLNFLLGKNRAELKQNIAKLFKEYPKAFECLHIILAVRDKKDVLFDSFGRQRALNSYFSSVDGIYEFMCESSLAEVFTDRKIKDLNDFVFGVEVGLDSNARKNRSGSTMENLIAQIFKKASLEFKEQVYITDFTDLHKAFGEDIKKFDFVVFGKEKTYFIECNFYSSGGSKLNETSRAYQDLAPKFDIFENYEFIWITDGQGWLQAKNKLEEAYKSVELYNLSNIQDFISKVKNDKPSH